jgi:hypothetical protein
VLEGESGGARAMTGDDKHSDLDNLAFTSRRTTSLLLSARDVAICGDAVAATGGQHGEQDMLECAHRRVRLESLHRRGRPTRLERLATGVMSVACGAGLTRG